MLVYSKKLSNKNFDHSNHYEYVLSSQAKLGTEMAIAVLTLENDRKCSGFNVFNSE